MNLRFFPVENEEQRRQAFPLMTELYSDLDFDLFCNRLERAQQGAYKLNLVFDEGVFIGFAAFSRYSNMIAGDVLYLEEMAVVPALRQKGYGRAIIDHIKTIAKQEGRVSVYTDDSTPQGSREDFLIKAGGSKISSFYEFKVAA